MSIKIDKRVVHIMQHLDLKDSLSILRRLEV